MAHKRIMTPLYVGPIDNVDTAAVGTICTVVLDEPRITGRQCKPGVLQLTDLQQRVNVHVINNPRLPVAMKQPDRGVNVMHRFAKDKVCEEYSNRDMRFLPTEVLMTDVHQYGAYQNSAGLTRTSLTPWLSVAPKPVMRYIGPCATMLDVSNELKMFASGSCPVGVVEIPMNAAEIRAARTNAVRNRTPGIYSFHAGGCVGGAAFANAVIAAANAATAAAAAGATAAVIAAATAATAAMPPRPAAPNMLSGVDIHGLYFIASGAQMNAANIQMLTDHIEGHVGVKIRLEQSDYLRAVSKLLVAAMNQDAGAATAFAECVFEGWVPVHQVHSYADMDAVVHDVMVVDRPDMLRNIMKHGGAQTSTGPLDHLPSGMTQRGTVAKFVQIMGGVEVTTLPPAAIAQAGDSLWIGHKIKQMTPGVTIHHLAAEMCRSEFVALLSVFLEQTLPIAHNTKAAINVANIDLRDAQNLVWRNAHTGATRYGMGSAIVAAHDTHLDARIFGGEDAKNAAFFDAAVAASKTFEATVDAFIAANNPARWLELAARFRPLLRRYVQHTKFGLYDMSLAIAPACPMDRATWLRSVRFSTRTAQTSSEEDAKKFKTGDYPKLHLKERITAI